MYHFLKRFLLNFCCLVLIPERDGILFPIFPSWQSRHFWTTARLDCGLAVRSISHSTFGACIGLVNHFLALLDPRLFLQLCSTSQASAPYTPCMIIEAGLQFVVRRPQLPPVMREAAFGLVMVARVRFAHLNFPGSEKGDKSWIQQIFLGLKWCLGEGAHLIYLFRIINVNFQMSKRF